MHGIPAVESITLATQSGTSVANTSLVVSPEPIGGHEDRMDVEPKERPLTHPGEEPPPAQPIDSLDVRMNKTEIPVTPVLIAPGKASLGTPAPQQSGPPNQAFPQTGSQSSVALDATVDGDKPFAPVKLVLRNKTHRHVIRRMLPRAAKAAAASTFLKLHATRDRWRPCLCSETKYQSWN